MASIFTRNGRLYAQFYDANRSPKRKQFSHCTDERSEARRKLADLERAQENGDFDPWQDDPFPENGTDVSRDGEEENNPTTVSEAIDEFCEAKKRQGRTQSTIDNYRKQWRLFRRRVGGETAFDDLKAEHVRSFVYDGRVKATTGANRYRHVGAVLRWFNRDEVMDAVEKPKTGEGRPIR